MWRRQALHLPTCHTLSHTHPARNQCPGIGVRNGAEVPQRHYFHVKQLCRYVVSDVDVHVFVVQAGTMMMTIVADGIGRTMIEVHPS